MAEELKDSGIVTALSVVGLVFGLIGMFGSFIPCLGSLAFLVGVPAAVASVIALGIAYSKKAKKTFAIVALTISMIGVVVSGMQYFSIIAVGKGFEAANRQAARPPAPAPAPAPAPQAPAPAPVSPVTIPTTQTNSNAQMQQTVDNVKLVIVEYYKAVEQKRVEDAIQMYASERIPSIKRNVLEAIAKDTEYYRVDSMVVSIKDDNNAIADISLYHKKRSKPEEYWKVNISMFNENGRWKIWSTPGSKVR